MGENIFVVRNFVKKNRIPYVVFQISLLPLKVVGFERVESVRGGAVVMPRRPKETLLQVKTRLKREQAERTRRRVGELLLEAEQETVEEEQAEQESEVEQKSEVRELLRQSTQLLRQVEEERKGTVRVSLSCCYCTVCVVVCILFGFISVLVLAVRGQQTS